MKRSAAQVLKDAQELPERDRVRLIEKLLESWEVPADPQDDESYLAELDRRTKEIETGKAKVISWDKVKKQARASARGKR